ncbi:hypothetical protein [Clostridium botulinum]|uniref:Uncharacterized protein n=1 Tax=Clostridium botulinum TaxID=1491 RepID=A0A0L9Y8J4_CLOBO|nr:hypothetical protein [Clostridium botulinum]KAI3349054.1 hypothetical protein CIT18_10515 [Clostridium botulinum]KOM88031.1 hypothetical protein ACP51_10745 [Clostridium botulinum]KOR62021.1 hypothetical protein ADT22_05685 [Clostridium botulinum]MBY7023653.1 hypothetical protein [Clostridium botulinum]NFE59131.1 hypothetical protein [Clostridium botulinum]
MTCECIGEVKQELEKRYSEKGEIEAVTSVSLENTALMFRGSKAKIELYSPVKIEFDYKNKKGDIKHKKEKANMGYRYCPFCGKCYEESEE